MLHAYKPIAFKIKEAQKIVDFLVLQIWCKPTAGRCSTLMNTELKALYNEYDWFKKQTNAVYKICRNLDAADLNILKLAYENNNQIEKLCNGTLKPIYISSLHKELRVPLVIFFSELYTKFLGWGMIYKIYGKKKDYYDQLITGNHFVECPCCGYGDIKTQYSKGHSPFDHYLPQKHYPFTTINFNNLVPMCHICNSDNKGETDIIKNSRKVFYPFAISHPQINIIVDFDTSKLPLLINDNNHSLPKGYFKISFTINTDKTKSWDQIFDIKNRYSGKIADFRVSWFKNVTTQYAKYSKEINNYSVTRAFDDIIEDDSNKQLGFLKSPYLTKLRDYSHLIKAIQEVSGSSQI